jgi:HAD superfamily hydrolase (TIGR01509 family)
MGEIKAVSFDGDMTLWDFQKVMRHSLAITLTELRRRLPGRRTAELTIDTLVQIRGTVATELKGRTNNLEEVRFRAFERALEVLGCPDQALASDLNALYLKHRFDDIELYPDVIPCLDRLRTRYVLGLLSNGNGYPDRCGLPGRFGFVVFAQDVGAAKPDAVMFHAACRQAGCAPGELVHVGDSLGSDVAGAKGVGAVSVWLNRQRHVNDSGIVPDYEVNSLAELVGILVNRTE